MGLNDEITNKVNDYLNSTYTIDEGYIVPQKSDIGFGAKGKKLKHAVVMFTDLRGSKKILSDNSDLTAARAHKAFLYAASKCVRDQNGKLRSFNGDSVLSFFTQEDAAKRAVTSALKLKGAVDNIINPLLSKKNIDNIDFGIGIAQGPILVVKSGIPGEEINQDLLWIGWATYHAYEYGNNAKRPHNIWISKNVFEAIKDDDYLHYSNGQSMWVWSDETFSFGTVRTYQTTYRINL